MLNAERRSRIIQKSAPRFSAQPSSEKIKNRSKKRNIMMIALVLLIGYIVYSLSVPSRYFRSPLKIRTEIAGSFGEVRKDHFHLGLDIRTNGRENMPVFAMADGYIYRASIQRNGYGKALYIAYNNGFMSVYAHLNSFTDDVTAIVNKQQLLSEQWEQEMFFPPRRFPVKKGNLVGYSGNSGSSDGPHLHLELRNPQTKTIVNPVPAGITVADNISPSIRSVWLYNGSRSIYETTGTEIKFNPPGKQNNDAPVIVADSFVRIGIEANDKNGASKFRLGIYQAQLFMDNQLWFEFKMDSIPIGKERYVNATIDYAKWFHQNRIIQFLFRLPGNHFPPYLQCKQNGIIHLADDRIHRIKVIVKDANGNSKTETFRIRYRPANTNTGSQTELLIPGMPHKVSKGNVVAYFSPLAFYDAVAFTLTEQVSKSAGSVSKTIEVHDPSIPVHTRYRIQLKTSLLKNDPARKSVLMELKNGKEKIYVKGDWKGDYMDGSFDHFGAVTLIVDNIPPRISRVITKSWMNPGEMIRLECEDNTGDVENFTARIDGQWTPFEQKKNSFYYYVPEQLKKGSHLLEIKIHDKAGNTTKKKIDFVVR